MLLRFTAFIYFILLLFGCSNATDELKAPSSDDIRLITLAPHLTELVFLLKQEQYLVGVSEFSHFPDAAKKLPQISNHSMIFKEATLSVNPTHAFVWEDGISSEGRNFLQEHDIEIISFNSQSLQAIVEDTKQVEDFFNLSNQHSAEFSDALIQLEHEAMGNTRSPSVFYIAWTQPMISLGGKQLLSEVLNRCGAKNIFEDVSQNSFEVSLESVIQRQPDIVLISKNTPVPELLSAIPEITVASSALFRPNVGILPDMLKLCEDIKQLSEE